MTNSMTGAILLVMAVAVFVLAPNAVGWWVVWCGLFAAGLGFVFVGFAQKHDDDYDDQLRPRRD